MNPMNKLINLIPDDLLINELNKQWFKNTKFLDKFPIDQKKLKKVTTKGTKEIKYKNKQAFTWLKELKNAKEISEEQINFITWFQVEYPLLCFEKMKN